MIVEISANDANITAHDKEVLFACAVGDLRGLPTRYRAYAFGGLTYPLGAQYPPSRMGHALIFEPVNNIVRSRAMCECRLAIGESGYTFPLHSQEYARRAILSATTPAEQLMLVELALWGVLSFPSADGRRIGGDFIIRGKRFTLRGRGCLGRNVPPPA